MFKIDTNAPYGDQRRFQSDESRTRNDVLVLNIGENSTPTRTVHCRNTTQSIHEINPAAEVNLSKLSSKRTLESMECGEQQTSTMEKKSEAPLSFAEWLLACQVGFG